MKNNLLVISGFVIVAVFIGYLLLKQSKVTKVAFVRSQLVLDRYKGMDEAKTKYQKKIDQWKANYDTLEFNYNKLLQNYNSQVAASKSLKEEIEKNIQNQQAIVENYSKSVEQKANEENEKLTQGVLNQVNSFIKKYAEKNGYDIVLGITLSGNILYGSDKYDITDDIIKGLNQEYTGK